MCALPSPSAAGGACLTERESCGGRGQRGTCGAGPHSPTLPPPSPSSLGHPDPATALATGAWAALIGGGGGTSSFSLAPAAPLRGGKGGFGSLLRASGRVAKTTNFDACRDLSGRR